ncbi:hypothetical protein [Methylobacterium sp. 1973]|uniref:hypothetical protein n=1 Tax=Methylobacterium sp. 1973 TaxID=3156421 RepID=UPI003399F7F9
MQHRRFEGYILLQNNSFALCFGFNLERFFEFLTLAKAECSASGVRARRAGIADAALCMGFAGIWLGERSDGFSGRQRPTVAQHACAA